MNPRVKAVLKLIARLSVAAALLTWVFLRVDTHQLRQTFLAAKWGYVVGVYLSTAAFFWLQCLTMEMILKKQGCFVSVNTLFGISSITSLYSLVLPGILSTGVKWYILKRLTGKGAHVLSGMLYNQVTLSIVMVVIGSVSLIAANPASLLFPNLQQTWVVPVGSGALSVVVLLASGLLLNSRTGAAATNLLVDAFKVLPAAAREKGTTLLLRIADFQTAGLGFHLIVAVINAVNTVVIGLLIYYFAARAAGVGVSIGVLLWLCAMIFLLSKIPITVANLGVREWVLVSVLPAYGATQSASLLTSLILLSSLVFMAVLGVAYQLLWAVHPQGMLRGAGGADSLADPTRDGFRTDRDKEVT